MDFENLKIFMDNLTSWRIPGNVVNVYKDGLNSASYIFEKSKNNIKLKTV